jgi:hypothetical protein
MAAKMRINVDARVENRGGPAHTRWMTQKPPTKLLDVVVDERGPEFWEWRVYSGRNLLLSGFESSRLAARFAGNDTLFLLLASGWMYATNDPQTP